MGSTCSAQIGFGIILNSNEDTKGDDYVYIIDEKIIQQNLKETLVVKFAGDFSGNSKFWTSVLLVKESTVNTWNSNVIEYSQANMMCKIENWIKILKDFCEKNNIAFDPNKAKFLLSCNYS